MPSPSEISPARAAALLDDLTAIVASACAKISALSAARLIPRLKADQSPVTVADEASEALIIEGVARLLPGVPVISEESADAKRDRFDGSFLIVDPLDGTREFSEGDRSDWAVHVALVAGGELATGAVALPAQGHTLSTASPPPAPAASDGRLRLLVSRTRPSEHAEALAAALDADLVPMGSAGAKATAVITGAADVYAHSGGQYEWDSAAPVAVARASGLHTSRIDGSPLVYNQPDPLLPDLVVCRPEFAAAVLAVTAG